MKALVGAFNQLKALVGAFSVIVKLQEVTFPGLLNSHLLKSETMYPDRPRAYIFNNISQVNRQTKNRLVYSYSNNSIKT